ncbi:MAG: DNA recombination protein RmuC [Pseudohongiellaceae bacterium]
MPETVTYLVYLLAGITSLLLPLCLYLLLRLTSGKRAAEHASVAVLEERLAAREAALHALRLELEQLKARLQEEAAAGGDLRERLSRQETLLQQERLQHQEKLQLVQQAREQMSLEFKALANEILEQKGRSFSESSQQQLQNLLKPLGERILSFEKRVEDTYDKESKQRFALEKEIKNLIDLNTRISVEADNLTRALKGESKTQGNWGEVILERVLEKSGLQRGREYEVQVSLKDDDGGRNQPDVIVHLPEGKHVIVDAKVSLKDYEAYFSAEDDKLRGQYLRQHIQSIRNHIKGLSAKQYQNLKGVHTLDFVLLFLPVEPAFTLAVQNDESLFTEAFAQNIILVGPSTLLATLRTIQSIWRFEYQNKNALAIAESAGKLYEQFVAFTLDLERIGEHLDKGHLAWESACKRLGQGRSNLVRQVESLKKLGAKTSKAIGERWLEDETATLPPVGPGQSADEESSDPGEGRDAG